MTTIVLHDMGDDGEGWRSTAPDGWRVLDLPGGGRAPAPRSGHYDPLAVATLARWAIGRDPAGATVVGVGQNAHSALLVAAHDSCARVVLVDGLWAAIPSADVAVDQMYAGIRAMTDDRPATSAPPIGAVDPRTRHGYGVTISTAFLQRFWSAVTIPVLAVETPASATPVGERAERLSWFGGPVTLVTTATEGPEAVVPVVQTWQ